jgi:hypothetical protein
MKDISNHVVLQLPGLEAVKILGKKPRMIRLYRFITEFQQRTSNAPSITDELQTHI